MRNNNRNEWQDQPQHEVIAVCEMLLTAISSHVMNCQVIYAALFRIHPELQLRLTLSLNDATKMVALTEEIIPQPTREN